MTTASDAHRQGDLRPFLGAGATLPSRRLPVCMLAAGLAALLLGVPPIGDAAGTPRARPLTVRQAVPLAFGKLLAERRGQVRVTIPSGRDAPLPNRWSLAATPSHRARFLVEGEPGAAFVIELPSAIAGPGYTLTDFTSEPDGMGELDALGRATILVGATLAVTPDAQGPLQARFALSVRYP
jgi:hypothetical protein